MVTLHVKELDIKGRGLPRYDMPSGCFCQSVQAVPMEDSTSGMHFSSDAPAIAKLQEC